MRVLSAMASLAALAFLVRPAMGQSEAVVLAGYSVQGRPIQARILGDGPETTLVYAAVHGNETATPLIIDRLYALLKRYPYWLRGRRVVLVRALNPDGLQARRRTNARGVDINRNYPGTWRLPRRGERFKPGSAPSSEPETQAMMRLTNQYRPHKVVSIHQPLHCLIYTGERSRSLAEAMARQNHYAIKSGAPYPTPGGFGAYCEKFLQAAVVTLELPWQNVDRAWRANSRALQAAIFQPVPEISQ